jgi:hypothetical protein
VVHRNTVNTVGVIELGRRYKIGLGVAHRGKSATTVVTGTACHVFIDGRLERQLTLDQARRSQPRHRRRLP